MVSDRIMNTYDFSKTPDEDTVMSIIKLAGWDVAIKQGTLYSRRSAALVTPDGCSYLLPEIHAVEPRHIIWQTFLELTHRSQ